MDQRIEVAAAVRLRDAMRVQMARQHPAYLQAYVFGLPPTGFHWEWYDFVLENQYSVLEAARGHAKSTTMSVVLPLWYVGTNPNLRFVIASATAGQAEKFLREIGSVIRFNARYRRVFGSLFDSEAVWTQRSKTVRRSRQQKDATFLAIGQGSGFAGARADMLIFDDLVDFSNSLTKHRRTAVHRWLLETALPALDPEVLDKAVMVGTPWHFADALAEMKQVWPSASYPAMDGRGGILWEERFSREALKERKRAMGSYLFAAQYLVSPVGVDGNHLQRDWLQYDTHLDEGEVFYGVDTAIVPEEEASPEIDYTGVAKFRGAGPDEVQLWGCHKMRVTLPDLVDWLAKEAKRDGARRMYVEEAGVGRSAIEMLRRVTGLEIRGVSHGSRSKETRLALMAPHFEGGRVTLTKRRNERLGIGTGLDEFVHEWVSFPFGMHDDLLDAVEVGLRGFGLGGKVARVMVEI